MSLINEALKKAQRQRAPDADARDELAASASAPSGPIVRRSRPMPAQTLLLIVAGAAVLIVFSAIGTVYLMNRTPEPKSVPVTILPPPPVAPAPDTSPSPVIVAPSLDVASTASNAPAESSAPAAVELPAMPLTQSAPTAPTAERAPAPAPALPDPRIQTFVDAIRVAGIRSSGAESKVLMNDRVYRVGDTVDLALGIKLEAVAPDSLTFVDAHGASYKKNF
jgi:hypothetical protein